MRFTSSTLFTSILLAMAMISFPAASLAAAEGDTDLLESKVNWLNEQSSKHPLISFTSTDAFQKYARSTPRNYSLIIMFTSLNPRQNCKPCASAAKEFDVVADSWHRHTKQMNSQGGEGEAAALYFGIVEYEECPDLFKKLKLNSIPTIIHFPSSGAPKAVDTYKMQSLGLEADGFQRFAKERSGVSFPIYRAPNYTLYVVIVLVLAFSGYFVFKFAPQLLEVFRSAIIWSVIAMILVFTFLSGQMWNQIRQPPYSYSNPNSGDLVLFHPSSQSQFGLESQIMMILYAITSAALIMLNSSVPYLNSELKRRSAAYTYLGIFTVCVSLLFAIFRQKHSGYPFRLFL